MTHCGDWLKMLQFFIRGFSANKLYTGTGVNLSDIWWEVFSVRAAGEAAMRISGERDWLPRPFPLLPRSDGADMGKRQLGVHGKHWSDLALRGATPRVLHVRRCPRSHKQKTASTITREKKIQNKKKVAHRPQCNSIMTNALRGEQSNKIKRSLDFHGQ